MPKRKLTYHDLSVRHRARKDRVKRVRLYSDLLDVPPPRIANASSPHPLSLLESLPSEILLHIIDLLLPDAYLAVKFVSKRMNAVTKRQDGSSSKILKDIFEKDAYGVVMASLEAKLSDGVKLDKLTCRWCAQVFGLWDGEKGFDDKHFDRALSKRYCIPCRLNIRPDSIFSINGDHLVKCQKCEQMTPRKDAIQPDYLGAGTIKYDGLLGQSIESALEGWEEFEWVCRDCLKFAMNKAAQDMDMEINEAFVSGSEDSYYEPEVFADVYPVEDDNLGGTSEVDTE